jgi:hypothetical protein
MLNVSTEESKGTDTKDICFIGIGSEPAPASNQPYFLKALPVANVLNLSISISDVSFAIDSPSSNLNPLKQSTRSLPFQLRRNSNLPRKIRYWRRFNKQRPNDLCFPSIFSYIFFDHLHVFSRDCFFGLYRAHSSLSYMGIDPTDAKFDWGFRTVVFTGFQLRFLGN